MTHHDFKAGQRVVYYPTGAHTRPSIGIIREVMTERSEAPSERGPVTVKATEDEPRFLIENINTRKATAYKRENIERLAKEGEVEEGHAEGYGPSTGIGSEFAQGPQIAAGGGGKRG